jgi:hypothetical protein
MSIKLIDFKDIQDSIIEELKIQSSDTVSIGRIKRSINEVYINEVVPHARWKWLENHTKVRFNAAYSSGTAEVTPSSATITLTPAPSASLGSFANQYFSVAGHTEVYIIDAHAAGSATLTLTSQFLGVFNETAPFKIWSDKVALPVDCRETVTVWHNMYSRPMDAMGWQKFRELTINNPKLEGYPRVYYTGDFVGDLDATRYRELRVHPAIHNVPVTVSVDYVRDVVELTNDGDEPVIPMEDRIVLKYGALAWAWRALMRNPEEANTNYQLFKQKLERMAGKIEDSHDKPQLTVDSLYMKRRRAPRYKIGTQVFENGSGGSTNSSSSNFLQNPIIQGGRITAAVTVDSGVTVDGVDISVLAQDFADHLTDAIDAHDASSISFAPTGGIAATDVQTAIAEVATDADSALTTGLALKAPLASPTFTGTITTPLTASRAVVTGASSELAAATTTATEIGYVNGVTSAIQTQLDARQSRSTLTTKGDIYVATASATVARQAVGADGTFLRADSAQANGVTWASVAGSALAVTTKTTTYTATTSDDVILCTSGSAWTLTLYAASGNSGKTLTIKKTSSDTNAITIDGNASETIDGVTTTTINSQYETLKIICDGSNWHIVERKLNNDWASITITPAAGFGTATNAAYFGRRIGDSLQVIGYFKAGTVAATTASFDLSGLTIDTAKIPGAGKANLGTWYSIASTAPYGSGNRVGSVFWNSGTATLNISASGSTDTYGVSNVTEFLGSNNGMSFNFTVPITGWKGN